MIDRSGDHASVWYPATARRVRDFEEVEMQEVEFGPPPGSDQHTCSSTVEGDWVVFRCRRCPDYERRVNWRTGATRASNVRPDVPHFGNHVPLEHQVRSGYLN
jgi:hypothetical protein